MFLQIVSEVRGKNVLSTLLTFIEFYCEGFAFDFSFFGVTKLFVRFVKGDCFCADSFLNEVYLGF